MLLAEAFAQLGQLPGPALSAAQHIVACAQAIIRDELNPDELNPDTHQFCWVALSEARAAVVAATYAARHIHDANIRGRYSGGSSDVPDL